MIFELRAEIEIFMNENFLCGEWPWKLVFTANLRMFLNEFNLNYKAKKKSLHKKTFERYILKQLTFNHKKR